MRRPAAGRHGCRCDAAFRFGRLAARPRRPYAAGVITDRDIARWRLRSQLLAAPVDDAEQVVRSLLAVQAENPSQSAWAVATRTDVAAPG